MITREVVTEKLLAYLNHDLTLAELVDWAGLCFVEGGFLPEEDTDMLVDMVMYIAGAHHEYFPLTWDVISDFLEQLGVRVANIQVVPLPSA